tara:strand:+ start:50741 stop:54094 length:3354 start_codon:yes stop_codon:yes gene_type:complete
MPLETGERAASRRRYLATNYLSSKKNDMRRHVLNWLLVFGTLVAAIGRAEAESSTLQSKLKSRPLADVAQHARVLGDATRGAIIFYRQGLSCTQCHTAGEGAKLLGPDLSQLGDRATYEHVVESIVYPSKVVRDGFRAQKLLLEDGRVMVGMVQSESDEELVLFIPGESEPRAIPVDEIEARSDAKSIMPDGLINQLQDTQEFYDLVDFLVTLGKAGADSAESLRPDPALLAPVPLPRYEKNVDHAGLISSWNVKSKKNGEAIYLGLCVNCHGTEDEPGSLPNALRFASGKFKSGSDPYSIYRTLTHGYQMMLPQRQLVPQQKYDVIHFIRESYLKPHNPSQYTKVDARYLAGLPKGKLRGPEAVERTPWSDMDYGPFLISTYEMVGPDTGPRPGITKEEKLRAQREGRPAGEVWPESTNFAYKGIAIRLDQGAGGVSQGSHWLAFDHDTMRIAGAWSGSGFIDWRGILFNGNHAVTPRTVGDLHFGSLPGPGWAHPVTGIFEDPRLRGKDGRAYGPLPREWAKYRGIFKHGDRVIVAYDVGDAPVLESHSVEIENDATIWTRTLNVGPSTNNLLLRVCPDTMAVAAIGGQRQDGGGELEMHASQGYVVLSIPAAKTPVNFDLRIAESSVSRQRLNQHSGSVDDLSRLTNGGPPQRQPTMQTIPQVGDEDGPFAVDMLTRPTDNPWKSRLRMSGVDFFDDGDSLVVCCCDGDVWIVRGINDLAGAITWKRIASGLFHPLGIKVIEGRIFVTCRDQIMILNDRNGDGETDFYECFNNDHQVTDHFHEFAMGLQADSDRNLYYAKSARHARDSLVPHHGTLLRVSADGKHTTILANGFRAANGVCLNPDGSFFVTDQEGHWNPMNRINRVVEGGFYGNMYGYGAPDDSSDDAMQQPLCWPNKPLDRSPAELLWVDSDVWGPLNGALLNLSYGYGKVFVVPHEEVDGQWQGGVCRLPLPEFPTGVMRARFHPNNGQMYACGMHAWGSNQNQASGGLYRIRYTGRESLLPIGLAAHENGVTITFTEEVDPTSATDPRNFLVDTWALKRSSDYGSDRYDERSLQVAAAKVSADGRSVTLQLPEIRPTWCMEISYKISSASGKMFSGTIQNTIHKLSSASPGH